MRTCAFLLAGLTALTGCGSSERTAGGSSYETENALAIRVLRPDGTPASGVDVRARPLRWIEGESYDASLDLRSDSTGTIRLNLPSGAWRLEARQGGMFAIRDNRDVVSMADFERAVIKVLANETSKCTESGVMFA